MGEYPSIIAVGTKALYLAPGERADVIVDFSKVPAGSKLILYNDAPAPAPNGDSRVDYYTGRRGPDRPSAGRRPRSPATDPTRAPSCSSRWTGRPRRRSTSSGSSASCRPPTRPRRTRAGPRSELRRALTCRTTPRRRRRRAPVRRPPGRPRTRHAERAHAGGRRGRAGTPASAGGIRHPHLHAARPRLPADAPRAGQDGQRPVRPARTAARRPRSASTRRSRRAACRTAVPYSAIDPATEYLALEQEATAPQMGDATQIWRVTHDGTTSHSVAFGGFDVQVVERARRDGETRAPDPGELGWKDTLRVDPLESVLIAVRPVLPELPFKLPASARALDITLPLGAQGAFTQLDPVTAAPLAREVVNARGRPELRGLLEHPPHRRRGEPHRPAARAPGRDRGAGRADGDGRRRARPSSSPGRRRCSRRPSPATSWNGRRTRSSPRASRPSPSRPAPRRYTDTTAQSGSTYFYRVRTEAAAGWSPWSAAAEVSLP